jgi:ferredoxin
MRVGDPVIQTGPFVAEELPRAYYMATARRELRVSGSSPSELNRLRRALLTRVKTLAVDRIDIRMNTSSMPDEVLALQLGLTPLKSCPLLLCDADERAALSEILEEAAGESGSLFTLRVRADASSQDVSRGRPLPSITPVRAGDLRHARTGVCISVFPSAVIHFLLDGHQSIDIEACVRLATPEAHHKHCSFSECAFIGVPRLVIAGTEPPGVADVCPAGVFGVDDGRLVVANPEGCTMCGECVKASPDTIHLSESDTEFILILRPTGRMSVERAIACALESV